VAASGTGLTIDAGTMRANQEARWHVYLSYKKE
jgi:hypothetical protein